MLESSNPWEWFQTLFRKNFNLFCLPNGEPLWYKINIKSLEKNNIERTRGFWGGSDEKMRRKRLGREIIVVGLPPFSLQSCSNWILWSLSRKERMFSKVLLYLLKINLELPMHFTLTTMVNVDYYYASRVFATIF